VKERDYDKRKAIKGRGVRISLYLQQVWRRKHNNKKEAYSRADQTKML
jgi:hypothetical protein